MEKYLCIFKFEQEKNAWANRNVLKMTSQQEYNLSLSVGDDLRNQSQEDTCLSASFTVAHWNLKY